MIDGNALSTRLREEAARRLQAGQETINGYAQTAREFGVSPTLVDTIIEKISSFFSWLGGLLGITSAPATETPPPAASGQPPAPAAGGDSPAPAVAPPAPTPPGAPAPSTPNRGTGR